MKKQKNIIKTLLTIFCCFVFCDINPIVRSVDGNHVVDVENDTVTDTDANDSITKKEDTKENTEKESLFGKVYGNVLENSDNFLNCLRKKWNQTSSDDIKNYSISGALAFFCVCLLKIAKKADTIDRSIVDQLVNFTKTEDIRKLMSNFEGTLSKLNVLISSFNENQLPKKICDLSEGLAEVLDIFKSINDEDNPNLKKVITIEELNKIVLLLEQINLIEVSETERLNKVIDILKAANDKANGWEKIEFYKVVNTLKSIRNNLERIQLDRIADPAELSKSNAAKSVAKGQLNEAIKILELMNRSKYFDKTKLGSTLINFNRALKNSSNLINILCSNSECLVEQKKIDNTYFNKTINKFYFLTKKLSNEPSLVRKDFKLSVNATLNALRQMLCELTARLDGFKNEPERFSIGKLYIDQNIVANNLKKMNEGGLIDYFPEQKSEQKSEEE